MKKQELFDRHGVTLPSSAADQALLVRSHASRISMISCSCLVTAVSHVCYDVDGNRRLATPSTSRVDGDSRGELLSGYSKLAADLEQLHAAKAQQAGRRVAQRPELQSLEPERPLHQPACGLRVLEARGSI